jgi:hypothetical protein
MNAYYTHQKYLKRELDSLKKTAKVLELGVGDGSSPLMYEFCQKNPRAKVFAFENDEGWLNNMKSKYELKNYSFSYLSEWNQLEDMIESSAFDLVFVDQSPWEARTYSIDLLKGRVKTFIVHDYDYFNHSVGLSPSGSEQSYISDENSFWGKTYSQEFILEDNYELLPPTLIMRKK